MEKKYFDHQSFYHALDLALKVEEKELKTWLCDTLNIDRSNVERRITGQVRPRIDEVLKILHRVPQATNLCLDLLKNLNIKSFEVEDYATLDKLKHYLAKMLNALENLLSQENPHIYYCARDLPLFYFFKDKDWVNYKVKLWSNIDLKNVPAVESQEIYTLARMITEVYDKIPSTELWFAYCIPHQLNQLDCELEAEWISKPQYQKLKTNLKTYLTSTYQRFEKGEKNKGVALTAYRCMYMTMQNSALLSSDTTQLLMGSLWDARTFISNSGELNTDYQYSYNKHLKMGKKLTGAKTAPREQWLKAVEMNFSKDPFPLDEAQ